MKQPTLPFNSEEIKPKVVRQLEALKKWAQPTKPKLDDRGYPTEASDEQMAVLHDKVMTNRYITGANRFGEYPDPKTKMQLRREAHQQKIKDIQEKKKTAQQIKKFALEESSEPIIKNPYMKKAITDAEIQKKLDKQRGPSDWEVIYDGMSPQEKGSWNAEKRKQGMNGKTGDPIGPRAVSGRPFPPDTFSLSTNHEPRTTKGIIKTFTQPAKKETDGLSEDFVIQKLREKSIF